MNHSDIRYARQTSLPQVGPDGQRRLAAARAVIVGLGGLGAPAAVYLARAGVGHLTLCDFDRVDETNLPRQILYTDADIGVYKTVATAAALSRHNPGIVIDTHDTRIDKASLQPIIDTATVVLDCTDNFAARTAINRACHAARRPLVSGAAIRFEGQLCVFDFANDRRPCYDCLYTEADESLENCAGQGVFGPVVGMVGCMIATESMKLILGLNSDLRSRLWVYDALAGAMRTVSIAPRADCPTCAGHHR